MASILEFSCSIPPPNSLMSTSDSASIPTTSCSPGPGPGLAGHLVAPTAHPMYVTDLIGAGEIFGGGDHPTHSPVRPPTTSYRRTPFRRLGQIVTKCQADNFCFRFCYFAEVGVLGQNFNFKNLRKCPSFFWNAEIPHTQLWHTWLQRLIVWAKTAFLGSFGVKN